MMICTASNFAQVGIVGFLVGVAAMSTLVILVVAAHRRGKAILRARREARHG